jgi:hypothetical protein
MTMSIKIGNAVPTVPTWKIGARNPPNYLKWDIEDLVYPERKGAPNHGYAGNFADMGRGYLEDAIEKAGLAAIFWGTPEALMYEWHAGRSEDGLVGLTVKHVEEFERALASYKARNPDAVPGIPWSGGAPDADHALAKLEWLAYWTRWAVTNCRHPALSWDNC